MNPNLQERKMKKKPISEAALNALKGEVLEGNLFQLKAGWVKAAVFRELRIIFETMIGTWSKEEKGFKFTACPKRMIEEMIASGGYIHPPDYGYFPTPATLAESLVEKAKLQWPMTVLEPSAGQGAIAKAIAKVLSG